MLSGQYGRALNWLLLYKPQSLTDYQHFAHIFTLVTAAAPKKGSRVVFRRNAHYFKAKFDAMVITGAEITGFQAVLPILIPAKLNMDFYGIGFAFNFCNK
ncbi:hypothetical protein GCM10010919_28890 [Alishewanella longhuensis]|uniref:Uncharacterized protein n=1 Tax=Alishewanella longhuensis TaxID=1091037 RepID=A0ABQ3L154_9ALTE|nr:hypothetical protein GCM10010919_28890 [Alishewanella longhuensis]